MNTKQMVALWYTGLAAVVALLVYADSATAYSSQPTFPLLPVLASIVIVGGLLVATFRTTEDVDQKRVLLYSLGPPAAVAAILVAVAGGVAYFSGNTDEATSTTQSKTLDFSPRPSEVHLVNPCLKLKKTPKGGVATILIGRIRNTADYDIDNIHINTHLHKVSAPEPNGETRLDSLFARHTLKSNSCEPVPVDSFSSAIDGHTFTLDVDVPPQSTRSFNSETAPSVAPTVRPSDHWKWSYEIQSVY